MRVLCVLRRVAHAGLVLAVLAAGCDNGFDPVPPAPPPPPSCLVIEDFLHTVAIARPPGGVLGTAVAGDVAFAAAGTGGLHIFDISDPADVRVITTIPLADARAVDVDGTVLYVAAAAEGLVLVDIANPSTPAVAGTAEMPGCAVDVDATGARAYVANDDIGLVIVDVTNAAAPSVLGIENTPGKAVGVVAREPLAFVADEVNGLRIVNVSDPAAPFVIKTVPVPGAARGVAVSGNVVAIAAREGDLRLVDVTFPPFATVVGTLATPRDAVSVATSGKVAFVAIGSGGIDVVDISTPAAPVRLQTIGTANVVRDVAVAGNRLAIADDIAGARVMSIATPTSPAVDAYLVGGDIRAMTTMGDLLVVADASFGLRVFDPGARAVVGEIAINGGPRDVAVIDSIAYLVTGSAVPVVDLRDPASPAPLPALPAGGPFDRVAVADEFAYLLASDGLLVEQRRDGTGTPRSFNAARFFASLTLEGSLIYLPERQGVLYILSRSTMGLASIVPTGASAESIAFRRTDGPFVPVTRGWVAESGLVNGKAALEVYDFSSIMFPQLVGTVACAGNAVDVAFTGTLLAVAEGDDGCEIFEFVGEGAASPIGYYPEPAYRVVAAGDRFAVAAGASGLLLIGFDACFTAR